MKFSAWIRVGVFPAMVCFGCAPLWAAAGSAPQGSRAVTPAEQTADQHAAYFTPPPASAIPDNAFGALVREGRAIFTDTQSKAGKWVGNGLNCVSCHLGAGRVANAAPLWAAWGMYPAYRKKNHHVNTFAERLQGCFRYSMNGKAPPANGEVIVALESYSYWLAKGAPTGVALPGRGYPKLKAAGKPGYARGQQVFKTHCALCHGDNGQGQKVAGRYVFPPLWGPESFNWGAGMHKINTAADFIKANMPLGRGGMLSDRQAWDVAYYMDAHERPQDPRFDGSVAATRKRYHDTPMSLYGTRIKRYLLGSEMR